MPARRLRCQLLGGFGHQGVAAEEDGARARTRMPASPRNGCAESRSARSPPVPRGGARLDPPLDQLAQRLLRGAGRSPRSSEVFGRSGEEHSAIGEIAASRMHRARRAGARLRPRACGVAQVDGRGTEVAKDQDVWGAARARGLPAPPRIPIRSRSPARDHRARDIRRVAVFSGSGVPSRDQRMRITMSEALGGSMASWKCPEASIGSCSQR